MELTGITANEALEELLKKLISRHGMMDYRLNKDLKVKIDNIDGNGCGLMKFDNLSILKNGRNKIFVLTLGKCVGGGICGYSSQMLLIRVSDELVKSDKNLDLLIEQMDFFDSVLLATERCGFFESQLLSEYSEWFKASVMRKFIEKEFNSGLSCRVLYREEIVEYLFNLVDDYVDKL